MPTVDDVRYEIQSDLPSKCTRLCVSLSKSGWIIKGIILENEQLFRSNNGVYYQMQTSSSNQMSVLVCNEKNTAQSIKCSLAVGQGLDSKSFHKIVLPSIEFKSF